jgi:hypothetical protein
VLLFTDQVSLRKPPFDLGVDFLGGTETEGVKHVARREHLDPREARALEFSREHHVAVDPIPFQGEGCKAHADLKSDPCLLS